jgi:hopanoid biosynthesis associated protein HpnK
MVAEPAAADAVARARRLPELGVGLHLTLVEGRPVLPPERLPDLVHRSSGRFRTDMARLGLDIFVHSRVRKQLAAEITAQFEAFAATGLPLDHVNAHKHFHLHPTIAREVIRIGRRYGMRALRVPLEPASVLARVEPGATRMAALVASPWARLLRHQARRAGLATPDAVLGLAWSGAMTAERVAGLIQNCPDGLTEIYAHPATGNGFAGRAPGYRYAEELAALTSSLAREALRASGARLGGYADFCGAGAASNASA